MLGQARGRYDERFRDLYDRTYERVWAYVLRRGALDDEARDIVSDTYLVAWRRIRDIPDDHDEADAWVFAAARRVCANHRRAIGRRERLRERLRLVRPEHESPAPPDQDLLLHAVSRLPKRQQELLQLSLWDELTNAQIARVLGCSENAVAVRLTRARAALRDAYDGLNEKGGAQ